MTSPLAALPHTPAVHVQLRCYGAVLALRAHAQPSAWLDGYCEEPARLGLDDAGEWAAALGEWERAGELPLLRLGLDAAALDALFLVGILDEDARFAAVLDELGGRPYPTRGLLHSWWPATRPGLRDLLERGIVTAGEGGAGRADAPLRVHPLVWDALRGDPPGPSTGWLRLRAAGEACALADLVVAPELAERLRHAPAALASGAVDALVVRGPAGAGRRTVAGAVAALTGRGVLEVRGPLDPVRWAVVGPVATLLDALPLIVVGPGAHEGPLPPVGGPCAVVAGLADAVTGEGLDRAVTVVLGLPDEPERVRHWRAAGVPAGLVAELARRHRMTGGTIRRVARAAQAEAAVAGRAVPVAADVAAGARARRAHLFAALATRVEPVDDPGALTVAGRTRDELHLLEARCRHREDLAGISDDGNAGVRALFVGPSGTGKSLAARVLAGVVGIDLYRVDVATVVDKYLGETEKNLARLFAAAEESDAALLLDEGDSLMTRRTDVATAHDRYANLETNYLLARMETFQGILLVTSNAADRIDRAFRRRMDVVVDFAPPDELARWCIWHRNLPAGHGVVEPVLAEVVERCGLTGGQIRNAVLHAALLGARDAVPVGTDHVIAAVRREYGKLGQACPLGPGAGR